MYFYCFFIFEYFDPYDHYAVCWVTLTGEFDVSPYVSINMASVLALTIHLYNIYIMLHISVLWNVKKLP